MSRTRCAGALLAAALAVAAPGCGLIAPFDLRDLRPADGDGDADSEPDAAGDGGRTDGDSPGDAEADRDDWNPLEGCDEDAETDERWLVLAGDDGGFRSWLTGRDCEPLGADERPLCEGCVASAFSPSGRLAAAFVPTDEPARVHDEVFVIDLEDPSHPAVFAAFDGTQPAWIDDATLVYLAAPDDWEGPCDDDEGRAEVVELRRRDLAAGEEEVVGDPLGRSWHFCCPAVSPEGSLVALGEDLSESCRDRSRAITVVDLDLDTNRTLEWTVDGLERGYDFPAGLLPSGDGFLVQTARTWYESPFSVVYATTFDGRASAVLSFVDLSGDSLLLGATGPAPALWAHCATARRIGPACELHCCDPDGRGCRRYRLADGSRVDVDCSRLGPLVRIMDVLQVRAGTPLPGR